MTVNLYVANFQLKMHNITIVNDHLYLLCSLDSTEYVVILNKNSLEIINKFSVNNFYVGGICLDVCSNILVTGLERNDESVQRFIFCLDSSGKCLNKFLFDTDEDIYVNDMFFIANELIVLTQDEFTLSYLRRIRFEIKSALFALLFSS